MTFHIQDTNARHREETISRLKDRHLKMRGTVLLLLGVVIGINISSSKAKKHCYSCVGAASPADCNRITTCGDHQNCFEEEVVIGTNILFNSGCRSKLVCPKSSGVQSGKRSSVVACSRCCDTDFCNVGMCGHGNLTGLRCLSCEAQTIHPSDCDRIEQCSEDDNCYAHRVLNAADLEPRYEMGCRPKLQCQGIARVPFINQCFECCDTPMCNLYKCGSNWTVVYHTSSQPTIIEATTSTHSALHYSVAINGSMSVAYHGQGRLQCMSNAHNPQYTWTFNETLLPPEDGNILHIKDMTETNVGTYKCIVSKDGAIAEASTSVTITEAPPVIISVSSLPTPAQIGKELNIHCNVTGYPVPVVHWVFTNPQGQAYVPEDVHYPSYGVVQIDHFQTDSYRGNWTCVAMNNLGTDVQDIIIQSYDSGLLIF